jgi:hypothetical protein
MRNPQGSGASPAFLAQLGASCNPRNQEPFATDANATVIDNTLTQACLSLSFSEFFSFQKESISSL